MQNSNTKYYKKSYTAWPRGIHSRAGSILEKSPKILTEFNEVMRYMTNIEKLTVFQYISNEHVNTEKYNTIYNC